MALNFQMILCYVKRSLVPHAGLILFLFSPLYSQSQSSDYGLPYIRNFTQKEYGTGAQAQNWSIVQDQRGIIYVGNTTGVLEYDGVFWRRIGSIGKAGVVFSLAIDANNRIYVGSFNELGYLAPDSIGQMQYVSLLDRLPQACRNCANVWYIHVLEQSVYFMTPKYIFRFKNGNFKVWEATTEFRRSFVHDEKYYVKQQNLDLMVLSDDSMVTIPGLEALSADQFHSILPYDDENLLIGTVENGLYLFNGRKLSPFGVSLNELIIHSRCVGGLILADSSIALNSYNNGIIVLNRKGELITNINKSSGLVNDRIMVMFADKENGLWLATDNGISRIELPSPFTSYNEQMGVEGKIEKICRHQGTLYAATSRGIYRLPPKQASDSKSSKYEPFTSFKKIQGINSRCWDMLSFGPRLLVITRIGFFEIIENNATLLNFSQRTSFKLVRSQQDSNRIFIGLDDGLASIYYNSQNRNNPWLDEGRLAQFKLIQPFSGIWYPI